MRAWESVLAAACALCTAAVALDHEGVKQPLLGRALDPQHMMQQLPALSQLREVKPESLQAISSKPPTSQTQLLPDSETTLCTAAAAVSHEGVKQPLLGRALEPQHMMQQLPAQFQLPEVKPESLQVESSKPPTSQAHSLSHSETAFSADKDLDSESAESPSHLDSETASAAAAMVHETVRPPLLVKKKKPQRMAFQLRAESSPRRETIQAIQVILPKPATTQTHSLPDSTVQPPQQALSNISNDSSTQMTSQYSKMTSMSSTQKTRKSSDKKCNCFHEPDRKWLDCSSRNRTTIRADDLCDEFITHVNLSHNNLVSLPENLGDNVRSVNLSHNLLTAIPRSPPLHPRTRTLDLSFNRISNSSNELRDMFYLKLLYVQGNRLQSLDFLPSPCSLHTLLASHNQLRSLEGPLFYCFLAVEIDLSWNQLTELSKTVIGNLYLLTRLHLVHSGLLSIPPGVFERSLYLRFVDLSRNKLTTLPSRAFDGGFIETIILDKNNISALPHDTFSKRYPYSILKISLAQNKLKKIPPGLFSELMSLQHLNLNQNYLRYLPDGIFDGLNLTEIYLQSNLLEKLPPRLFSGLKNLKRIDLGGNQLASVPDDLLADLSNLELLDLSDNVLTVPAGLFNGVKSIEVLDLSYNFWSTFNGSQLEGLDHVEWLYLKGNDFVALPVFDDTWPQVVNFNVERNHIVELSEEAVRSWLGDGSQARRVTLGGRQWLRSVGSLRWVVNDPNVTAIVDVADCRCGFVNRGHAHLFFCASVWCPGDVANWVDAASHTDNEQTAP